MVETTLVNPAQGMHEAALATKLSAEHGVAHPRVLIGGAIVGLLAIGGSIVASHNGGGESSSKSTERGNGVAELDCPGSSFEAVSTNSSQYGSEAFLPKANKLASKDDATSYVRGLFDKNGPLASKIDPMSLAAIDAATLKPSHDNKVANPNYDFHGAFKDSKAAFSAPGGLKTAEERCQVAKETLFQTGQFNPRWADKGELVTKIAAVRNDDNKIVDMAMEQGATFDTLSGIEFIPRGSTKKLDGFTSVLVDGLGQIWIKGITVGSSGPKLSDQDNQNPAKITEGDITLQAKPKQSNGQANSGNNQTNNGTGNNTGVTNGTTPESNPNGPNPGPGNGPQGPGPTPEASPGPGNTPGTGTGGNTPGTTPNSPGTTPDTTPSTTSPTTSTTTPTTTPASPPTTKGPAPCDPNIARCSSASVQESSVFGSETGAGEILFITLATGAIIAAGKRRSDRAPIKAQQGVEL